MYGAVDIGGTKTLIAVFSKKGEIIEQIKFPTPKNYEEFKIELAKVVDNLSTTDFVAVGVGAPGRIDRKHGVVISCGNLGWKDIPLQHNFEKIFKAPIMLENDAKLAGLSEALLVEQKYKKTVYITLSTGIGIALVINGAIDINVGDGGGKHMILEHDGKHEAWEDFASGSAIVRRFGKRASEIEDPDTWKIIARDIGLGLRDVIAMLEPEVVIIGGGVGTHFNKYGKLLTKELDQYETPVFKMPPVIQAQRAEEAVIYGCYELAKQHHAKVTTK